MNTKVFYWDVVRDDDAHYVLNIYRRLFGLWIVNHTSVHKKPTEVSEVFELYRLREKEKADAENRDPMKIEFWHRRTA